MDKKETKSEKERRIIAKNITVMHGHFDGLDDISDECRILSKSSIVDGLHLVQMMAEQGQIKPMQRFCKHALNKDATTPIAEAIQRRIQKRKIEGIRDDDDIKKMASLVLFSIREDLRDGRGWGDVMSGCQREVQELTCFTDDPDFTVSLGIIATQFQKGELKRAGIDWIRRLWTPLVLWKAEDYNQAHQWFREAECVFPQAAAEYPADQVGRTRFKKAFSGAKKGTGDGFI